MAKEYDEEIKKLFGDYRRAKSRISVIEMDRAYGTSTPEKELEYTKLQCLLKVVDCMLEQLSPLRQRIVENYYIYSESLYDIAELLHYSYYHCSNEKNEAVDELIRIFNSTQFDSIVAKAFEKQFDALRKESENGE